MYLNIIKKKKKKITLTKNKKYKRTNNICMFFIKIAFFVCIFIIILTSLSILD